MKRKYFLTALLCACFAIFSAQAQFVDDFDWVETGICPDWWTSWSGSGDCMDIEANDGCSPPYGGYIRPSDPGSGDVLDPILDLGNQTSGQWSLSFCMYVPSDREGYFNLQGVVPVGGGEWIVGNIHFNADLVSPGLGYMDDSALGPLNFDFPHDEWFDVEMNFDLTGGIANATWEFIVASNEVVPEDTPFTNFSGQIPTSLGGVQFFSISPSNEYWIDNIIFNDFILDIDEFTELSFSISPNPVQDRLNIETDVDFDAARIYALDGKLVLEGSNDRTIDVSSLHTGVYFVEVQLGDKKSVQKLVKQ